MPVTAKLSRQFYEKLGDEVVNELVEWLNQVDSGLRAELRELNDLNFARFEAKLDTGLERIRTEMASFKAELIKWMFLFWLGTVATMLAITQAVR